MILSHPSVRMASKIIEYVRQADYQIRQSLLGKPRYYRFIKPESDEFPHMLEIFAANSEGLDLSAEQNIIPIRSDDGHRLSAILLDDEYFDLVKTNAIVSAEGDRIINHIGNICLKAKAFREMSERKKLGLSVDASDLDKHRNDVLKLALTLRKADRFPLSGIPLADLKSVRVALSQLNPEQVSGILHEYGGQKLEHILKRMKNVFIVGE